MNDERVGQLHEIGEHLVHGLARGLQFALHAGGTLREHSPLGETVAALSASTPRLARGLRHFPRKNIFFCLAERSYSPKFFQNSVADRSSSMISFEKCVADRSNTVFSKFFTLADRSAMHFQKFSGLADHSARPSSGGRSLS